MTRETAAERHPRLERHIRTVLSLGKRLGGDEMYQTLNKPKYTPKNLTAKPPGNGKDIFYMSFFIGTETALAVTLNFSRSS
jgi:hypothetical protein